MLVTLAWVITSTTVAQALSWSVEWVRTLPHAAAVLAAVVSVTRTGTAALLDDAPTRRFGLAAFWGADGSWALWWARLAELGAIVVGGYLAGLVVATSLARRPRREESRAQIRRWPRRPDPTSDLTALVHGDRASVWRSVPLRRGAAVLAVLPGAVAAFGRLPWETMPVLPGLVASGAALLFGVNAWCLDGPGAWWRESLPAHPGQLLLARAIVLTETVAAPMVLALVLAVSRARTAPDPDQVLALACSTVVITGQVVSRSLDWAVRRPYAADLRGARATPAPPGVLAGYSARLAVTTTATGIAYGACGVTGRADLALALSLVLALVIARRARLTARRWDDPEVRSRVVAVVARS